MNFNRETARRPDPLGGSDSFTDQVASKIAELVGVGSVGLDDDFFELGGDSLGAVELVMWAEQLMGRSVATPALFNHTTPRALAHYLIGLRADG